MKRYAEPRKKTSLGKSFGKSRAYNPIPDSGETSAKRLAKSLKSLAETLSETLGETFGETLDETFRARQVSPQSLGSDYIHGSPQDSLRDSFLLRGEHEQLMMFKKFSYHQTVDAGYEVIQNHDFSSGAFQ